MPSSEKAEKNTASRAVCGVKLLKSVFLLYLPLKIAAKDMGGWISLQTHLVMKVWTLLLEEWGIEYEEQALLALLRGAKNHGLDTTREAALDINTWAWTDRFIIKGATKANKSANKVLKPWKLILDLLRQLNTEVCGEDWVPDEVVRGMDTHPSLQRKRLDKTGAPVQCHHAALNRCPAPALWPGELDCTSLP